MKRSVERMGRPRPVTLVWCAAVVLLGREASAAETTTSTAPLALAARALAGGRAADALKLLAAPAGPLEDYRAVLSARAHLALEQPEKALAAVARIGRDPPEPARCKPACTHPLWIEAQAIRADAWRTSQPAKAAAALLELPADGARLADAAALLRAAEDEEGARAAERRLLLEAPATREARALADALGPDGVDERLGTPELRLARVRALLDSHENEAARDAARRAVAAGHEARCELLYFEGKASRKLRTYAPAITALASSREACAKAERGDLALRAALLETQVRAIRRQVGGTRKTARWIAEKHPEHSFADDALFTLAEVLERKGDDAGAAKIYREVVEKHPKGDQAPLAAWRLAFAALRRSGLASQPAELDAGAIAEARRWLQAVLDGATGSERDGARAHYWLARTHEASEPARAHGHYERAISTPPLTFYAFLALDRLKRIEPERAKAAQASLLSRRGEAPAADPAPPPSIAGAPPYARALALSSIGFTDAARAELALLDHEGLTPSEVVALALAYDRTGAHTDAQWLLRGRASAVLDTFPEGEHLPIWRAAYSRPFADELEAAAKAAKVEPLLLFALSREESTFDPAIVSWAGATGLTQLMPATAIGAYASVYRGRLEDLSRLTDPALNLRLGAHVLRTGLQQFGGRVPLALAAYNAGARLAIVSLPKSAPVDFDVWVETIPIKETRRYVKRVVGTWGIYKFLHDPEAAFIDLPDQIDPR